MPRTFHLVAMHGKGAPACRRGQRGEGRPVSWDQAHPGPEPMAIVSIDQAIGQAAFDGGDEADPEQQRQIKPLASPEAVIARTDHAGKVERPEINHDLAWVELYLVMGSEGLGIAALVVETTIGPDEFGVLVLKVLAETLDPQFAEAHGRQRRVAMGPTTEGVGPVLVVRGKVMPPDLIGV
ncbi:hypothetical protein D3C80_1601190 [compost metagenome]